MISDPDVIGLLYLAAIICFIVALRQLSSPKHARKGNWIGAAGMAWAIGVTLARPGVHLNWRIIVGAILILGFADDTFTKTIGFVAMVLATANVVGGWFVTDRMLEMFKRRPEPKKGDGK